MEIDEKIAESIVDSNQAPKTTMMTKSSIVAREEIEEWKTTQKKDPVVQGTIERVRQRQERNTFALTPQGLVVQEMDSG